jgi:hypothetical protein
MACGFIRLGAILKLHGTAGRERRVIAAAAFACRGQGARVSARAIIAIDTCGSSWSGQKMRATTRSPEKLRRREEIRKIDRYGADYVIIPWRQRHQAQGSHYAPWARPASFGHRGEDELLGDVGAMEFLRGKNLRQRHGAITFRGNPITWICTQGDHRH